MEVQRFNFEKGYKLGITEVKSPFGEYVRFKDYNDLNIVASSYKAKYYDIVDKLNDTCEMLHQTQNNFEQASNSNIRLLEDKRILESKTLWDKLVEKFKRVKYKRT